MVQETRNDRAIAWSDKEIAISDAIKMKKKWPACDLVVIEIIINGYGSTNRTKTKIFDTSEK